MKLSDWSFKDIFTAVAGASIPVIFTFLFSLTYALLHPQSEVRVSQTLVSGKSFYISVENHSEAPLEAITFVLDNPGDVKAIAQSEYAEVKVAKSAAGDFSSIEISQCSPRARTSILFSTDRGLDSSEIKFTKLPQNTRFIRSHDLNSLSLSSVFWAQLIVQGVLYFSFLIVIGFWRKSGQKN